eukprot:scaffold5625_cov126-Isochrysis_galbana.AAC.4
MDRWILHTTGAGAKLIECHIHLVHSHNHARAGHEGTTQSQSLSTATHGGGHTCAMSMHTHAHGRPKGVTRAAHVLREAGAGVRIEGEMTPPQTSPKT